MRLSSHRQKRIRGDSPFVRQVLVAAEMRVADHDDQSRPPSGVQTHDRTGLLASRSKTTHFFVAAIADRLDRPCRIERTWRSLFVVRLGELAPPVGSGSRASSPGGTGECGTLKPKSASSGALGRDSSAPTMHKKVPPAWTNCLTASRSADENSRAGPIEINSPQRSSRSGVKSGANSGKYPCRISVRTNSAMPWFSPRSPANRCCRLPNAKRRCRRLCCRCRTVIERPSGNTRPDQ